MFSLVGEIQCSYLGHKGRCFDVRVSPNSNSFITASEDGTAKIWNLESRKCVTTLKHNNKAEVLRAAFLSHNVYCTGGSDGKVIVWMHSIEKQGDPPRLCKIQTLNHRSEESQIYACEPFNRDTQIVTAADNHLYLWDIETTNSNSNVLNDSYCVQSWNFGALSAGNGASAFGGARNVDNEVYVFDAKVSPSMLSTIGVALSDASIRLLDTRQSTQLAALQTISLDTGSQPKFADQHFGHATSVRFFKRLNSFVC
jgi:WD40 repeat protein